MKIVNWFNFDSGHGKEDPKGQSMTVPDQSMSVQELLDRYVRGQDLPMKQPIWNGEEEFPDIAVMTPQERLDYARELQDNIVKMQAKLDDAAQVKSVNVIDEPQEPGEPEDPDDDKK